MDTVNVSEIKSLVLKAQTALAVALHALDTKVLVGEINRPSETPPKVKRKRRTKKEIEASKPKSSMRNPLEPANLPDADKDNTFYCDKPDGHPVYGKPKKERKKREKKVPIVE